MQSLKNRTKAALTNLFLLLAIATIALACLPSVNAAVVIRNIYLYNSAAPNPVGVGQRVLIVCWTDLVPAPDTPTEIATNERAAWHNITVTITKPDGSTQTIGPLRSDAIGSVYTEFSPETSGTYYIQSSFSGQWRNYTNTNREFYYQPTTSTKLALTVQEEQIREYPGAPLPTGFWQRPIENQNREWSAIASHWLGTSFLYSKGAYNASGSVNPYSTAPNSAHILWTKPIAFGGIVGGEFGDRGYYSGLTYESKWTPPIIMNGRLYYNTPSYPKYGFECVDLLTGETLWWHNSTGAPAPTQNAYSGGLAYPQLTNGQLYDYDSPNQHGINPYLWSLTNTAGYQMYDAFTGNLITTFAPALTGQVVMSEKGDMLVYILNGANNWLAMWNSSRVNGTLLGTTGTNAWQWRPPVGKTLDWRTGIQWNVTVPDVPGTQLMTKVGDVILAASSAGPTTLCAVGYDMRNGNQLFAINITSNNAAQEQGLFTFTWAPPIDGVFAWFKQETREWYGFDAYSGNQLWGPTEPYESAWGMFSSTSSGNGAMSPNVAYGKLYTAAYDGMLHCIDVHTGKRLWDYYAGNSGLETPYGSYPLTSGMFAIADGKVYVATGEHSPNQPMWRGSRLHVVNATTGEGLWNVLGWYETPAIADGHLVAFNNYDSQIYCFGKGKTATTASASPKVSVHGNSVLIEGTVTDQSPGAKNTPAIADESMSAWMEYLYMQKPMPTNATGVEVSLDTFDPNGNFVHIGTVTSDASGMFKKMWTPEVPGEYTVIASFAGSESYYSSYTETAIGVEEAPLATAPPEYPQPIDNTLTIVGVGIAIMIVVAIAAVWIKRK